MIYQPPPTVHEKGSPVVYYEHGKATHAFMGGKIGGYRTIVATPGSDSGWCAKIEDLATTVFAAPNEHGVFPARLCAEIAHRVDRNYSLVISYLQCGPNAWCMAVTELRIGNGAMSGPVSRRYAKPTFEAVAKAELPYVLKRLGKIAAGGSDYDIPKSSQGKARKFAKDAINKIVAALPRQLASDILKSLTEDLKKSHGQATNG